MKKPKSTSQAESREYDNEPGQEPDYQLDPIIDGMLERLPAPGDPFPASERKLWLQIWELVLKLVYPDDSEPTPDDGPTA